MENLILGELSKLSDKFDNLIASSEHRLTLLETQIAPLVGDGQSGRCETHKDRLDEIETKLTLQEGHVLSRHSMFIAVSTICTLLFGMIGTGILMFNMLHKQGDQRSQQLQTGLDDVRVQLTEHQDVTNNKLLELQDKLGTSNAMLSSKSGHLANDVNRNSRQITGVGVQVENLNKPVPKQHWFNK
jgi:uncharacterized coiled-coil protein SlyX